MNRRGFIGKALAAVAAVPLLNRLVPAREVHKYDIAWGPVEKVTGVWIDSRRVYPHFPKTSEAARNRILSEVEKEGESNRTLDEFMLAFDGWNYERIDAFLRHA